MTTAPNRWLRFSLRTLFVGITLIAIAAYWGSRLASYNTALYVYEHSYASWQVELTSLSDVCEASFYLYRAEVALPLARQNTAAIANLERLQAIKERVYWTADNALFGDADEPRRLRENIDPYFAAAESLTKQESDDGVVMRWLILVGIMAAVGWASWRSFGPERKFWRAASNRTS